MSANDDSAAAAAEAETSEKCCASCGIAAIDGIKLEPCPHCDLVEYCSDQCQQKHRESHEAACKKRAAELYDEKLFKQPESTHLGDCPICCLPMPLDLPKISVLNCCGKTTCLGCTLANQVREAKEKLKEHRCPFCRHIAPETDKEIEKNIIERAKLNDPIALQVLGIDFYEKGDYDRAFEYLSKAAALGDVASIYNLSVMYRKGEGVEVNRAKERVLLDKAAIAGHPSARNNLGVIEANNGRFDRAVTHWIIAATLGCENSIKVLKQFYKDGLVSKDDFAAALRANQAAVDETKSPQREAAEAYYSKC